MTLQHIRLTLKLPEDLPLKQKLKFAPILLGNMRTFIRGIEESGAEGELRLGQGLTKLFEPVFESEGFKEGYQLFDRYDRASGVTFFFVADWTEEETKNFINQFYESMVGLVHEDFSRRGINLSEKAIRDAGNVLLQIEVRKALPLRRFFDGNLAAAKRRMAKESKVRMAPMTSGHTN